MRRSERSVVRISSALISATLPGVGSARPISRAARRMARGVRSSWEALAAKRRWLATACSSRSSMASKVSARSLSSSCGPVRAMRSCRVDRDSRRAVAVMRCSGRSSRPVSHQHTANASTAIIATPSRVTTRWESTRVCWNPSVPLTAVLWPGWAVGADVGGKEEQGLPGEPGRHEAVPAAGSWGRSRTFLSTMYC